MSLIVLPLLVHLQLVRLLGCEHESRICCRISLRDLSSATLKVRALCPTQLVGSRRADATDRYVLLSHWLITLVSTFVVWKTFIFRIFTSVMIL